MHGSVFRCIQTKCCLLRSGRSEGWKCLEKTVAYIRSHYPDHFVIADAKRGDIGNTAVQYARLFLSIWTAMR
jgi:orotidine-5'-phosphate decarboxylase